MEAVKKNQKKTQRGSFKVRAALLLIQTLLPIGLYFSMIQESSMMMWLIGMLFITSMGLLVWLG